MVDKASGGCNLFDRPVARLVVALTTRRGDPQSVLPRYQRIGTRQRHLGCLGPCWLRSMRSKYRCQA